MKSAQDVRNQDDFELPRFDEAERVAYSEGKRVALAARGSAEHDAEAFRSPNDIPSYVFKVRKSDSGVRFDLRGQKQASEAVKKR